jgi:hypothetical protein
MATLVSNRPSSYAITSVMIWDQHNSSLLHHEDHLSGVEISIGTKQSRTGCSMSDIAANGMFPVPSGFIQKGLLCGSAGTSIAVSVKGLLENSTNKNASEPFLRNDPRAASRFFYTYLRLINFFARVQRSASRSARSPPRAQPPLSLPGSPSPPPWRRRSSATPTRTWASSCGT